MGGWPGHASQDWKSLAVPATAPICPSGQRRSRACGVHAALPGENAPWPPGSAAPSTHPVRSTLIIEKIRCHNNMDYNEFQDKSWAYPQLISCQPSPPCRCSEQIVQFNVMQRTVPSGGCLSGPAWYHSPACFPFPAKGSGHHPL